MQVKLSKLSFYLFLLPLLSVPSLELVVRDGVQTSQLNALDKTDSYKTDITNGTNAVDNTYVLPPIALTDNQGLWIGPLNIGTPEQTFNVVYDTGSPVILIPLTGTDNTIAAAFRHLYNPESSSTAGTKTGTPYPALNYATGEGNGKVFVDNVAIGTNIAPIQKFPFIAGTIPSLLTPLKIDGILGLDMFQTEETGVYPIPSYISTLLQQPSSSSVNKKFTFLPKPFKFTGADFTIGADHPSLKSLDGLVSLSVSSGPLWTVGLSYINAAGSNMNALSTSSPKYAVLDTGANYITGPSADVRKLIEEITEDMEINSTNEGGAVMYSLPCGMMPSIFFEFTDAKGQKFEIPAINLQSSVPDPGTDNKLCSIFLRGATRTNWSLGTPFLYTVYSQFNIGTVTQPPAGSSAQPTISGFSVGLIPLSQLPT